MTPITRISFARLRELLCLPKARAKTLLTWCERKRIPVYTYEGGRGYYIYEQDYQAAELKTIEKRMKKNPEIALHIVRNDYQPVSEEAKNFVI